MNFGDKQNAIPGNKSSRLYMQKGVPEKFYMGFGESSPNKS